MRIDKRYISNFSEPCYFKPFTEKNETKKKTDCPFE